jgi:hypothetical protein
VAEGIHHACANSLLERRIADLQLGVADLSGRSFCGAANSGRGPAFERLR